MRLGIVAKLVIFLSGFFALVSVAVAFFVFFSMRSAMTEKHVAQGKVLAETYAEASSDALETKDDILLISYMERLKHNPDVTYAMVLASDGRVIVHTDSAKVREKLQDNVSLAALSASEVTVQEVYDGEKIYDVSAPVLVNFKRVATFRMGYNTHSIDAQMDNYRQLATLALILMIALSVVGVFAAGLKISRGFSALGALIDSLSKGRINEKIRFDRDDEVSDLAAQIQKAVTEVRSMCDNYEDKISSVVKGKNNFVRGFAKFFNEGLIVLDDQNKIIYANQPALGIIEAISDDVTDKHIIEITRSSEIMGLLADAEKQPNTVITQTLSSLNTKASICTITDETGRDRAGTILVLE